LEDAARGALAAGVPFFGVCVGFQLLYEGSTESPGAVGLGIFPGAVAPLPAGVKHPQMQWNTLQVRGAESAAGAESTGGAGEQVPEPLRGLGPQPWVYFVHSFAPPIGPETTAVCDYGGEVAALATRGGLWGAQFHPEKSGATGLALLGNFVRCAQAAA
jgi:glutamine amidotransferase